VKYFVPVLCGVLALLSTVRGIHQLVWNADHTGRLLGYHPVETLWPLVMAVLFTLAGVASFRGIRAKSADASAEE
jgi:hypothetical protein